LAYSVDEAARLTGLSRDLLYDQMRFGNLDFIKVGRRRLITRQNLERFLDIAPKLRPVRSDEGLPTLRSPGTQVLAVLFVHRTTVRPPAVRAYETGFSAPRGSRSHRLRAASVNVMLAT
jgi:excisionase family DNA binding protein